MLISIIFIGLLCVMQSFPDTAVGRGLRRWMVEIPARKLDFLTPKLVIGGLLMTVVVALLTQVVPVSMAMIMAGDLGAYMEITVAVTALLAGAGTRRLLAAVRDRVVQGAVTVRRRLAPQRFRMKARTARRPRRVPPPDVEGRPAWA